MALSLPVLKDGVSRARRMNLRDFLTSVLPRDAIYFAASRAVGQAGMTHIPTRSIADVGVIWPERDCYYAPAGFLNEHIIINGTRKGRAQPNVKSLRMLWLDLDPKNGVTREQLASSISRFSLPPAFIVSTGHGYHVYYRLPDEVSPTEWSALASGLRARIEAYDRNLCQDTSQWCNPAALLRLPGSVNQKNGASVTLMMDSTAALDSKACDWLREAAVAAAPLIESNPSAVRQSERPHYVELLKSCAVIRDMATHPENVSEPLWYAALGVLHGVKEGKQAAHELSRSYPGYDAEATERKYDQWTSNVSGLSTCANMRDRAEGRAALCDQCPKLKNGTSPVANLPLTATSLPIGQALSTATRHATQDKHSLIGAYEKPIAHSDDATAWGRSHAPAVTPPVGAAADVVEYTVPEAVTYDLACEELARFGRSLIDVENIVGRNARYERLVVMAREDVTEDDPRICLQDCVPYIRNYVWRYVHDMDNPDVALDMIFISSHTKRVDDKGFRLLNMKDTTKRDLSTQLKQFSSHIPEVPRGGIEHLEALLVRMYNNMKHIKERRLIVRATEGWEGGYKPKTEAPLPSFISSSGYTVNMDVVTPCRVEAVYLGNRDADMIPVITTYEQLKTRAEAWATIVAPWVRVSQGVVPMAASLASPFIDFVAGLAPTVVAIHGDKATFKSSSLAVAYSAWYDAGIIMKAGSVNNIQGFTDRATHLRHVPLCVDEFNYTNPKLIGPMLQTYTQGTPHVKRSNLVSDNYGEIKQGRWSNIAVLTGNSDPMSQLLTGALGEMGEGASRRFLPVAYAQLNPSSPEAQNLIALVENSYEASQATNGAFGPYLVSLVQKEPDAFRAHIATEEAQIDADFVGYSHTLMIPKKAIALLMAVASFTTQRTALKFDMGMLRAALYASMDTLAEKFNQKVMSPVRAYNITVDRVLRYMETHYTSAHVQIGRTTAGTVNRLQVLSMNVIKNEMKPGLLYEYPSAAGVGGVPSLAKSPLCYWVRDDVMNAMFASGNMIGVDTTTFNGFLTSAVANTATPFAHMDMPLGGVKGEGIPATIQGVNWSWTCIPTHYGITLDTNLDE